MLEAHHSIQLAAHLTGLSTHAIRIWEQRYQAVEPDRTPSNHRLYSRKDIERLTWLRDVTHAGHKISQVARLTNHQLQALARAASGRKPQAPKAVAATPAPGSFLDECLRFIESLDALGLDDALKRATTALGAQGVLQRLVAPNTEP